MSPFCAPLPACLQACLACKGVIIFTGVGKSGLIAQASL